MTSEKTRWLALVSSTFGIAAGGGQKGVNARPEYQEPDGGINSDAADELRTTA